jgi:probable rRNA maturation factor
MFEGEDFEEELDLLGDIVVNLEYAERLVATREHRDRVAEELGVEASTLEWGLPQEVDFLIIHGLLHLVGHDHADAVEEAVMKAEERRLWEHAGSIDI